MPLISNVNKNLPIVSKVMRHWSLPYMLTIIFLLQMLENDIYRWPLKVISIAPFVIVVLWNLPNAIDRLKRLLPFSISLFVLWIYFGLSYFWSVIPAVSLNLVIMVSLSLIFSIIISICFDAEGFYNQLNNAAIVLVFCSIVYACIFPGSMQSSSGATLFYTHKNILGPYMGLCFLILFNVPGRKKWHILLALVAFLFLLLSQSKTSIGVVLISSALLPLVNWWVNKYYLNKQRKMVLHLFYPFILICLVMLVLFRDQFLDLLWNNLTKDMLTGRGTMWLIVIQLMRSNSLFGIGPGTFWNSNIQGGSEISHTMLYMMDPIWIQKSGAGDGSYIDLIASIGVFGLALFLYTAADLYRGLIQNWERIDSKLIFVLTTFVLLHAVTETTILRSWNVPWFIYILCYLRVARYVQLNRLQRMNR